METTDFGSILSEAALECPLDPDNLSAAEFNAIRSSARKRLERGWAWHFWPDLQRTEQRWFAPDWSSATAYTAGTVVYYPDTDNYYQALTASTNEAPADTAGDTNLAFWTVAETAINGANYDATTAYEQGDVVYYGGLFYQLFAVSATGVAPIGTGSWGQITPFQRCVNYEQTGYTALGLVAGAFSQDPDTSTRGTELDWHLTQNGVVIKSPVTSAWIVYRLRCPVLIGSSWSSTSTYASGTTVYYSDASTDGNFYIANATTTAGESPVTASAKWDIIEIPRFLHRYLVLGIASDWLRGPGRATPDEYGARESLAQEELDNQKSLVVGQQSQSIQTRIQTR